MFRRASPSAFLPKIEGSSARSRESFDTSCSSVAFGSFHARGPFFSSVAVRLAEVLNVSEEPEVQGLHHQWHDHVPLQAVPLLFLDVQEVGHIFIFMHVWCMSWICCFRSDMPKVRCLFG